MHPIFYSIGLDVELLFLGAVWRIPMAIDNVLDEVEARLLDAHLFIRYFDLSDLEFLGAPGPEPFENKKP